MISLKDYNLGQYDYLTKEETIDMNYCSGKVSRVSRVSGLKGLTFLTHGVWPFVQKEKNGRLSRVSRF